MPLTSRIKIPYPSINKDNWYSDFKNMVESFDSVLFSAREDRNLIITGGGTVSFNIALDVGTLTWSANIEIFCPSTGFYGVVAPGSLLLDNSELFYVHLVRAPLSNATVTFITANDLSTSSQPDNAYLLGFRKDTLVYFRDGFIIGDGESGLLFEQTSLGAAALYNDPPSTINAGDTADPGISGSAARGDHQHVVDTAGAGDLVAVDVSAASAGVSTKIPRADHKHTVSVGTPGGIIFAVASSGSAITLARSDHTHSMVSGTPSATGTANAEGASVNPARVDHVHRTLVAGQNNGVAVASRPTLNFSSSFTVADNGGSDRLDISLAYASVLAVPATSGVAITAGQLVSLENSGGSARVFLADGSLASSTRSNAWGISLTTVAGAGNAVNIALNGLADIADALWDTAAPVAADVGKLVYMSSTAGNLTLTPSATSGHVVQKVGIIYAINAGSVTISIQIGDSSTNA